MANEITVNEDGYVIPDKITNMEKTLTIKAEIQGSNTPQSWTFSKDVSGVEQLAFWVIIKEMAEKNIKKLLS